MTKQARRCAGKSSIVARFMLGTALSGLAMGIAQAQTTSEPGLETVVVTGTSIRGAAPTGSNLITVDRATIESTGAQNVQQLLSDVPQINVFGGSGQGGSNSDFTGGFAPAIHGIGSGSSSATLVLIDGHRFPTQGLTEAQSDPTVLAASAVERVEVLPDGASAIYGSDAVSGVINFITRKNFTGIETNIQGGIADHYNTFTASALLGQTWNGGSVLAAYDYSNQSDLLNGSRSFVTARQDIRRGAADPSLFTGVAATPPAGAMTVTPAAGPGTTGPYGVPIPYPSTGVNFQNFSCPVATIAANSSASAFYYQPGGGYGGPGYSTSTSGVPNQGACDQLSEATLLPSTSRNSAMMQVRQELTETLTLSVEGIYGSRASTARTSRGTITGTVFGPTAPAANAAAGQINPFYVGNATTGTSSEFIRYAFDSLLGSGAYNKTFDSNLFALADLTWDIGNGREFVLSGTDGSNFNYQHISGVVDAGEALLALNGTTNTSGTIGASSESDIYALGTTYPGSRVLTSNNALDVWDPAGPTNKTNSQVIASLKDGGSFSNAQQAMQDLDAKFDGPVFTLPAGDLKAALGGEFTHTTMDEYGTTVNAAGPALSNSNAYFYREGRTVYAAYIEINAPLVSPQMNIPLMQSFSIDMSGRYDRYSDFGDTKNPKVAFDWTVVDGLKARGSYGTSFVAPTIHDAQIVNSQSNISGLAQTPANSVIPFGTTAPYNGGAGVAGTWVADPTDCAAGHGTVVNSGGATVTPVGGVYTGAFGCKVSFAATNGTNTSAGLTIGGGSNGHLQPAIGRDWEGGFDLDFGKSFSALDGLTLSATYWDVAYRGLVTSIGTINNLPSLITFAPAGGWGPQSAAVQNFIAGHPVNTALQTTTWELFDGRLQNAYNMWVNGIDFAVNYGFATETMGTFRFGLNGTQQLRYSLQGGNSGPIADVKNDKNSPRYNLPELAFRGTLGWNLDALTSQLAMNYISGGNVANTNFPYNLPGPNRGYAVEAASGGAPVFASAGLAHYGPQITFDFSASYTLPKAFLGLPDAVSNGTSVSLLVNNILNANPPFSSASSNGYTVGNPIGRLITVGVRKTL